MAVYTVTVGYVTVETAVPGGRAAIDIPRGATLPTDVPDEQVANLLALGHIADADAAVEDDIEANPFRPPTSGRGSGRDAWASYAALLGFEVDDDMSRDDIIAALDEE